jgi:hypothetical protein
MNRSAIQARDPFADLLDDFDGGAPAAGDHPPQVDAEPAPEDFVTPPARGATFRETCKKCNGRGRFIGYRGRDFGQCFACKGVGHFERLTSPAERQRRREGAAQRKANVKTERREAFAAAHPAEWAWMLAHSGRPTFTYPDDMLRAIEDWGDLTERQLEALRKLMAQDAQRAAARTARVENAPVVTTDRLMTAFEAAVRAGAKQPKLRFDGFVASLAPATGRNAGAVYLRAGDQFLGKIAGGKFVASFEATEEQQAAVVAAMADPLAAAVAFGRRTGQCSCCGRELTNAKSVELGIGPICREMFEL